MRRRRAILAIAGYIFAGAIATVAAAWAIARWGPGPDIFSTRPAETPWQGPWPVPVPADWPPPQSGGLEGTFASVQRDHYSGRSIVSVRSCRWGERTVMHAYEVIQVRVGFPFLSLQQAASDYTAVPYHVFPRDDTGMEPLPGLWGGIGNAGGRYPPDLRGLPLVPFWPGFLANTALYALLFFALRRAWFAMRTRRGACRACGYDLAGLPSASPCPECGRPVVHSLSRRWSAESIR